MLGKEFSVWLFKYVFKFASYLRATRLGSARVSIRLGSGQKCLGPADA